jgi:hypothetical protein
MRYRLFVRRFLNTRHHGAGAFVIASVSDTTGVQESYTWSEIELEIGDCARRICLEFPVESAAERRNSLAKARLLSSVLVRFIDALEQEALIAAERESARKALDRSHAKVSDTKTLA